MSVLKKLSHLKFELLTKKKKKQNNRGVRKNDQKNIPEIF